MKTMKDYLPKAWMAVKAMTDGLNNIPNDNFKLEMISFGHYESNKLGKPICYGCAATCAIQQAVGKRFAPGNISSLKARSEALKIDHIDMDVFEQMIDSLRFGVISSLEDYYDHPLPWPIKPLESLRGYDYKEKLGLYIAYWKQLKKLDL